MALKRINPEDLATPQTYTQVIVATGSRLISVAGQVAEDDRGNVVGPGDLEVQAHRAFDNVGRALAGARARPDQVAKITIFVVDYRHEHLPAVEAARVELFNDYKPVDTLIGVKTLAHPSCLIEIEAIAVVDDPQQCCRFEARRHRWTTRQTHGCQMGLGQRRAWAARRPRRSDKGAA
jgi:enamine deaminase RidA (YjgF/YER057c/UK114 family)